VNLPNLITLLRLVLTALVFVCLEWVAEPRQPEVGLVWTAFVLFLIAAITDFLDGYLARKWELTSTFGRIADPFADKIVVCGGFVMLTGVSPGLVGQWFAVVILFREFLVSGLRSFLESRGVAFGAARSGKLKMVVQSIAIPAVIFYEANLSKAQGSFQVTFYWCTVGLLGLTLILTVGSCYGYVLRAVRLIRGELPR
jgi:CDP-diacylglycerol--glycerol-3-phosphate 3-phosphatidyltransferase